MGSNFASIPNVENSFLTSRLRRLIEGSLTKVDPLKKLTGKMPDDRYRRVVPLITRMLIRRESKPTPREISWVVYGALVDSYADIKTYDESVFSSVGELIAKGWDDCWLYY